MMNYILSFNFFFFNRINKKRRRKTYTYLQFGCRRLIRLNPFSDPPEHPLKSFETYECMYLSCSFHVPEIILFFHYATFAFFCTTHAINPISCINALQSRSFILFNNDFIKSRGENIFFCSKFIRIEFYARVS